MRRITACWLGLTFVGSLSGALMSHEQNSFTMEVDAAEADSKRACWAGMFNDTVLLCYDPAYAYQDYVVKYRKNTLKKFKSNVAAESIKYLISWYAGQGLCNCALNDVADKAISCIEESEICKKYSEKEPGYVLFAVEECALTSYKPFINDMCRVFGYKPCLTQLNDDEQLVECSDMVALWPVLRLYHYFKQKKLEIIFVSSASASDYNKKVMKTLLIQNGYDVDDNHLLLNSADNTLTDAEYHKIVRQECLKQRSLVASVDCVYSLEKDKQAGSFFIWVPSPLMANASDVLNYENIGKNGSKFY